jgi:anti-sigma regulatory factor (Ser/Thr protein kinase)/anti-anti-sigma regulatory factor
MTSDGDHRPPPAPTGTGPSHPAEPILDQAFDADSLYALRAAVAAHATQAGLAPGRADDLVIAVHELAANAVRHGAGHGRLRIWHTDQALRCEIADDGAPEPDSAAQPAAQQDAPQWRAEPGHGLSLVRQVADQASLTSGPDGTLATVSFTLGPPGAPFRLDRRDLDDCTVLTVTGPLDLGTAGQLTDAITALLAPAKGTAEGTAKGTAEGTAKGTARGTPLRLVLDLSGLRGWDSAGLAALITAQQRISASSTDASPASASAEPARMVLAGLPPHLAKHLHEAGLADRFTLADSTAAAVASLT